MFGHIMNFLSSMKKSLQRTYKFVSYKKLKISPLFLAFWKKMVYNEKMMYAKALIQGRNPTSVLLLYIKEGMMDNGNIFNDGIRCRTGFAI